MPRLKSFLVINAFLILTGLTGCIQKSADEAIIEGRLTEAQHTTFYLFQLLPDSTPLIDSATTDTDGAFTFKVTPNETSFYLIRRTQSNFITIALNKNETISIEGSGRDLMGSYTVKGSEESVVLWKYNNLAQKSQEKIDSLSQRLEESKALPDYPSVRKSLDSAYMSIYETCRKEVKSFLLDHRSSLSTVIIVNRNLGNTPLLTLDNDFDLYSTIDSALSKKYIGNRNFEAFHQAIKENRKKFTSVNETGIGLSQGSQAPEIILPDKSGKLKKLSSEKGKVVLVYFWTSWNSAGREMNPTLMGIYEEFHARGFEIFGVSIDQDRRSWMDALRRDRTTWIQLNDSSGLNSAFTKHYSVSKLPALILLDREGKVISGSVELRELKALLLERL
jgi:peroxiredoxin